MYIFAVFKCGKKFNQIFKFPSYFLTNGWFIVQLFLKTMYSKSIFIICLDNRTLPWSIIILINNLNGHRLIKDLGAINHGNRLLSIVIITVFAFMWGLLSKKINLANTSVFKSKSVKNLNPRSLLFYFIF